MSHSSAEFYKISSFTALHNIQGARVPTLRTQLCDTPKLFYERNFKLESEVITLGRGQTGWTLVRQTDQWTNTADHTTKTLPMFNTQPERHIMLSSKNPCRLYCKKFNFKKSRNITNKKVYKPNGIKIRAMEKHEIFIYVTAIRICEQGVGERRRENQLSCAGKKK